MLWLWSSSVLCLFLHYADLLDVSVHINGSDRIVKRVEDDLNLYCYVSLQTTYSARFSMEWLMPVNLALNNKRLSIQDDYNQIFLRLVNLKESDSGDYTCLAKSKEFGNIRKNVTVIVKQKKGSCLDNHFRCTYVGHCIPLRYVCDGYNDCIDATDESSVQCGSNPCDGKIRCTDGRCLDRHLCCDPYVEPSCPTTHLLPCCMRFIQSMYNHIHPSVEQQRRYDSDLGFLQSTIYTVIGCAVAFVFIVTIMVIAVCRVHMKRSAMTPHSRTRIPATGPLSSDQRRLFDDGGFNSMNPINSINPVNPGEPFVYGSSTPTPTNSTNLLVTYNIGNGIQFVGRLVKPPSYSEIASESTIPEGPPPPYCSTDNLQRPEGCQSSPEEEANDMSPAVSPGIRYSQQGPRYPTMLRPNIIVNRLSDSE